MFGEKRASELSSPLCGPGNKGSELSNTLNFIRTLVNGAFMAFMYVMGLIVPFLWPVWSLLSHVGVLIHTGKPLLQSYCVLSIRLYRGGTAAFWQHACSCSRHV